MVSKSTQLVSPLEYNVDVFTVKIHTCRMLLRSNYDAHLPYSMALDFVKTSILVFHMRLNHDSYRR